MQPYQQQSLRAWVHEYVRNDILNGRYKPGEALVETKLSEEMGVSRTPVREAIRQLELEGLVSSIPNKGVVVTGVTQEDIGDTYAIRSLIEGLAVRWAVERIDEKGIKELEEIVGLMEYYTGRDDMEQVAKLDTRFHGVIYRASKSKVLRQTLGNLLRNIQHARMGSLKVPHRAQKALEEHKEILEAFIKKDSIWAERLMVEHISHASLNLNTYIIDPEDSTNS